MLQAFVDSDCLEVANPCEDTDLYLDKLNKSHLTHNLIHRLERLGYLVTLTLQQQAANITNYYSVRQSCTHPKVLVIEMQDVQSTKTRVLFVDDEQSIRLTLPAILEQQGFEVAVAASVPEALEIINHSQFEVLLTDLNIGSPADGFILVSAMRRVQPSAATFILTGYPDFQTALEAIRKQVDDYFTKPADIPTLVSSLRQKIHRPRCGEPPCKRVWTVILEKSDEILKRWLAEVNADSRLISIPMRESERIDGFPRLLTDLAKAVETGKTEVPPEVLSGAAAHGADRCRQGYTIPLLVTETRILNRIIATVLQEDLLSMNLSTLIPEALKTGEYLETLLEESIRAFEASQVGSRKLASVPEQTRVSLRRTSKAKAS